ncbi:helix-turn-helix domain-containing protein [Corynebacterium sp.]|uniref:helix-turn-helix transcriptional regulator n=1 Tax=Corynebacterium sp. TaxID=1720 RepID=UPI0028A8B592|nr:helix-turn-helix domain-containing protein [Corynebacterium sp.]
MHTDSPYLTIEEVIKATGLSRRTILKRVNAGLLNRYKSMSDARRYLYRREEVEALSAPTPV